MMQAMIGSPGQGRARAIKEGKKDQELTHEGMEMERPMGEGTMIAHGCS
jgi:hypothetical protein